jgi:DNA-binding transcriptional MerR regulator
MSGIEEGFSGPQACAAVGITYRQLDYWARTGLIAPSLAEAHGSGSKRWYSFADLVELRVVAQLLAAGVDLRKIRRALEELRHQEEDLASLTLLSDGTTIYACRSPGEVVDVLRRGQGVFGLALGPVLEEMRGSVVGLRPAASPATGGVAALG